MKNDFLLSVIIPVFNEERVLPELRRRLEAVREALPCRSEMIFVDDGGKDGSLQYLLDWAKAEPSVKVLSFTRNFGHQIALTAGLEVCSGDAAVTMDADLQDPPELLPRMLEEHRRGFDVVLAKRNKREGEGLLKRGCAYVFYRFLKMVTPEELPEDCGDFRLVSRSVLNVLLAMRERHRYLRGMVAWLGFRQSVVSFDRSPRFAGETHYSLRKMLQLAWDATISFSTIPLQLSIYAGFAFACFGVAYGLYALYSAYVLHTVVKGWTSLAGLICVLGGGTMVCVGIIGTYIAKIYEELKSRPLYVTGITANITQEKMVQASGAKSCS